MLKKKIRMALADDNDDDRIFFRRSLKDAEISATVEGFESGIQLMKYLVGCTAESMPDIIFLDIKMPFKDGIEILKEIRAIERLKNVPVVMFSTNDDEEQIITCFRLGANRFVRKPHALLSQVKLLHRLFEGENWKSDMMEPHRSEFLMQETPDKDTRLRPF